MDEVVSNFMDQYVKEVSQKLLSKHCILVTAESCTGGWLSQAVTSLAGSSKWFERGFVTYSNQAKEDMLGVDSQTLAEYGAVSRETALEMAEGALKHSRADISLSITGIAGPDGGSEDKPVGTVWFGFAGRIVDSPAAIHQCFSGDRESIRHQAVIFALEILLKNLDAI
ncbi:MAG: nicotinamide-nucleotide amidase [Gammaproteobacteria bacterium]